MWSSQECYVFFEKKILETALHKTAAPISQTIQDEKNTRIFSTEERKNLLAKQGKLTYISSLSLSLSIYIYIYIYIYPQM